MNNLERLSISLIIGIFIFSSCKNVTQNNNSTVINVKDAKDIGRKHVLDDVIEKIEFIPLDFNEKFPIGFTQQITPFKNRFYICDQSTGTIHIFNNKGNYIDVFHKIGRGPGEILRIKAFFVHENFNLSLLTYQKITTYDQNFSLINTIKRPGRSGKAEDFTFIDQNKYVIFNNSAHKTSNIDLFKGETLISEYGRIKAKDRNKKRFFKYGNTYNIIPLFYDNSILAINENFEIYEKYNLLLDEQKLRGSTVVKNNDSDLKHYGINHFIETKKYIYGSYGDAPVKFFLYNKETHNCLKTSWSLTQHGGIPLPIFNVSDDGKYLFNIISSIKMKRYQDKLKPDEVLHSSEIQKIKKLDIQDNPIIVKIKIKS